jgi:hypothetical protein
MSEDHFAKAVVETIAKRAGSRCSNPDCGALTSGPAEETARAIIVGEAAHIYGARPGSARFDADMAPTERSDITNAVWLCRNCHKVVDADQLGFPAELLFEWKRAHEQQISSEIGKTSSVIRQKLTERTLKEFPGIGYLSEQIIIDRPYAWEYKLTGEILRDFLTPINTRWAHLRDGLYAKPLKIIPTSDILTWNTVRMDEMSAQVSAIDKLLNGVLQESWGAPGEPGDAHKIYTACRLISGACEQVLNWEEEVKFAHVPLSFKDAKDILSGIAGPIIEDVFRVPSHISNVFSDPDATGHHEINIVISLPDGFVERYTDALRAGTEEEFG